MQIKLIFGTLLCSLLIIFFGIELIARSCGFKPIQARIYVNEPITNEPDPLLGWRSKPGSYNYPAYAPGFDNIQFTILPSGERATKYILPKDNLDTVIMIGCSFTQGWAVSDQDTFAWKLQEKNHNLDFRNFGSSGYNTYQSYLKLQQILPAMHKPKYILYGFFEDHERRNVAPTYWLKELYGAKRSQIGVPFLSLSTVNKLNLHKPKKYLGFPLRSHLASVVALENIYAKLRDPLQNRRLNQKSLITEKIIYDMNALSKQFNAKFYMVILHAREDQKKYYMERLAAHNINVIDCTNKDFVKMQVPGETHPNSQLHSLWADCIYSHLH